MRHAARAIVIKDNALLIMDRDKLGVKYCSLIGGGVDAGETPEQCLHRELWEETGVKVTNPRLVIVEDSGEIYGIQYIYLCDYVSGEPKLAPTSTEALINQAGQNLYTPKWLPLDQLPSAELLPKQLKEMLVGFINNGFPDQPVELTIVG